MTLSQATIAALSALASSSDAAKSAFATVREDVRIARAAGASWDSIGCMVGTSGEAARVRFGGRSPVRAKKSEPVLF